MVFVNNILEMSSHFIIFVILLLSAFHCSHQTSNTWGYTEANGPKTWPGFCQSGERQSPIDIVSDYAVKVDLGSLKFDKHDVAFAGTLTNTGHNVEIELSGFSIYLDGSGLEKYKYALAQMHFHWNAEHTIDGERDALELHLVYFDKKYGNVSTASNYANGICVVAVLYKLTNEDNHNLNDILNATIAVSQMEKQIVEIQHKVVPIFLLPTDRTTYYRYNGSLTTPGCNEVVTWFVMTEKLSISEPQLNIFQSLRTNDGTLKHNFRPTQELNDRKIYHHLSGYSRASRISSFNIIFTSFLAIGYKNYSIHFNA